MRYVLRLCGTAAHVCLSLPEVMYQCIALAEQYAHRK